MSRLQPPPTAEEVETAYMLGGINPTGAYVEDVTQQIRVLKVADRVTIPDHKVQLLRRIGNAQSELGRLNKLLDEIRADVLHLTTE